MTALALAVVFAPRASAREADDETFGGWIFTEVNHDFANGMYATFYFEHDNYWFQRLECNYFRLSVGCKVLPWLSLGVNYLPTFEPGGVYTHFGEVDVVGSLKSGNVKLSIRERYRHGFSSGKNELRSRLKAAYSFPGSGWGVYLAPEVITWGNEWKKTRHYVACTYNLTDWMQLEAYYMYYALHSGPAENVLGMGLNFDL